MNRWGITAVAVALGVAVAGPSFAADPPSRSQSTSSAITQAASPCPAGYHATGGVKKLPAGGTQFQCEPNKGEKVKCGPGTEYFESTCGFGCREKLIIK